MATKIELKLAQKSKHTFFQGGNFMLNRKQILSMAFLAIGVTMTQTAALASQTTTNAPSSLTTKPRVVKDCYYAGKRYSDGSVIKGSDGVQVQCVGDRWVLKS